MLDKYLYGADAVVLVYDVSNFDSFGNLQEWLSACKGVLQSSKTEKTKTPHFALVANKIDLEHLRVIKSDRHHKFAQDLLQSLFLNKRYGASFWWRCRQPTKRRPPGQLCSCKVGNGGP